MPAVDLIFPLFFYRSDPYKFNKEQLDYIKTYKDKSRINVGNNYISKSSHVLEDNKLKYIKSFIQKELDNLAYNVLKLNKKQKNMLIKFIKTNFDAKQADLRNWH